MRICFDGVCVPLFVRFSIRAVFEACTGEVCWVHLAGTDHADGVAKTC